MTRFYAMLVGALIASMIGAGVSQADEFERYAVESVSASLSTTQAGAHPDFTTVFKLNETPGGEPYALTRDVQVRLPPGLFGNPQAFPTCSSSQLGASTSASECPQDSQVGATEISLGGANRGTFLEPIYNMPASGGDVVARFGFFAGPYPASIVVRLDPADNSLVATAGSLPAAAAVIGSSTTFWGVPAAKTHDHERITPEEASKGSGGPPGGRESSLPETPFMTNPTECGIQRTVDFALTSYPLPDSPASMSAAFPPITGCGAVGYHPAVSFKLTSQQATSGTGLDYQLDLPTKGLEFSNLLYDSETNRAEVILPEGVTINPSQAQGLEVCSEADLARETYDSPPNAGCPEASKIGSVTAASPAIDRLAEGSLYVAEPYKNPFGSLLALYMVIKIPDRGVLVKLSGEVSLDPNTGRVRTVFANIPPLPVTSFTLHFREGARAPLVTPPLCGTYETISNLAPWAAPLTPTRTETSFAITSGIGGGPCPANGVPPFAPGVSAGTLNNNAGGYSPLSIRITRNDDEQEITGFSSLLPPGVTANLSGVPFCSQAQIAAGATKSGAQEQTEPSCPQASQIGQTLVGVGVGSTLAYTPGKLYMAGPYEGAPFSVVSITSAKVGPFDLGTVIVHLPLHIDPITAQVSIPAGQADQIPHIVKGIVVHVRDIRVNVDRPNFTINPTNCQPLSLSAIVYGAGPNTASATDDVPSTATDRFQAANCANLTFKPSFSVATSGKNSKANGASLAVKLAFPNAPQGTQANIRQVKVELPKQLPSRLTTLQKACTAAQFHTNPAGCPAASVVGHAKAITPILPVPIEGPAYFVSNGGEAFPNLIMVLQGYGVTIDLVGNTFISKTGITSSTFKTVPDQPVTSFELVLPQGPYSALTANGNFCTSKLTMPTEFIGQNGALLTQTTKVTVTGCPKVKTLTRAQRLALALKACHKQSKGKKRQACERTARKKYGLVKKKTKKK
jgi:hypothetical protein